MKEKKISCRLSRQIKTNVLAALISTSIINLKQRLLSQLERKLQNNYWLKYIHHVTNIKFQNLIILTKFSEN